MKMKFFASLGGVLNLFEMQLNFFLALWEFTPTEFKIIQRKSNKFIDFFIF